MAMRSPARLAADADRRSFGRVGARVGDQVSQHVVQLRRIAGHGGRIAGDRDLEVLFAGLDGGGEVAGDRLRERAQIAARDVERFLPRLEPRESQQVLHQPLHAPRMSHDDREEPARVLGARVAFRQRFHVAPDRRQRRPEFVGDVGDEVAADAVDAFQLGDVVQHEHDAHGPPGGHRGRADD